MARVVEAVKAQAMGVVVVEGVVWAVMRAAVAVAADPREGRRGDRMEEAATAVAWMAAEPGVAEEEAPMATVAVATEAVAPAAVATAVAATAATKAEVVDAAVRQGALLAGRKEEEAMVTVATAVVRVVRRVAAAAHWAVAQMVVALWVVAVRAVVARVEAARAKVVCVEVALAAA